MVNCEPASLKRKLPCVSSLPQTPFTHVLRTRRFSSKRGLKWSAMSLFGWLPQRRFTSNLRAECQPRGRRGGHERARLDSKHELPFATNWSVSGGTHASGLEDRGQSSGRRTPVAGGGAGDERLPSGLHAAYDRRPVRHRHGLYEYCIPNSRVLY